MISWVKKWWYSKSSEVFFPPILFLVLVVLLFFYPVFLGLLPLPSDLIVGGYYPWVDFNWGGFLTNVPVKNALITDAVSLTFPLKYFMTESFRQGEFPLWTHSLFGGYPVFASMHLGLFFPTTLFYILFDVETGWSMQIISQVLFAVLFMYLFGRQIKLSRFGSLYAAIAYGFGGFMMIWLEWNVQSLTAAFLPLLFFSVAKYFDTKKVFWGVLFSIAICLQIFAGLLQITFFSFLSVGFFIFYLIWFNKEQKEYDYIKLVQLVGFGMLGFLLSGIFLLPAVELLFYSQRFLEVIANHEKLTPIQYLITMLIPDYFGNPVTGNFWGVHNYTNVGMFTGTSVLFLAIIGAIYFIQNNYVRFLVLLLSFILFISIDNPFSQFLYGLGVWGGSSMTMNRTFFVVNFCLALLAGFGFEGLQKRLKVRKIGMFYISGFLFMLALTYLLKDNLLNGEQVRVALRNSLIPLVVAILAVVLVTIVSFFPKSLKMVQIFLVILLIGELFRFGWKFNTFSKREYLYPQTGLTQFLSRYSTERFASELDVLPPNMWVPYDLQSIGGYDSAYPFSTAKLIAVINSGEVSARAQNKNGVIDSFESPILPLINTRFYVSLKRHENGNIGEDGLVKSVFLSSKFKKVFEEKSVVVFERLDSLNKVYWASSVEKVSDEEALKVMSSSANFYTQKSALTDDLSFNSKNVILKDPAVLHVSNFRTRVFLNNEKDGFLVYSNTFYPGWEAFIDGRRAKIHKTNYGFQGVIVPGGSQILEFRYIPKSLILGFLMSIGGFYIVIGLLYHYWRNKYL